MLIGGQPGRSTKDTQFGSQGSNVRWINVRGKQPVQQGASLVDITTSPPETPKCPTEPKPNDCFAAFDGPLQRPKNIVMLLLKQLDCRVDCWGVPLDRAGFSQT